MGYTREQLYEVANKPGQKKDTSFGYYRDPSSKRHSVTIKRMGKIIESVVGPTVLDCGCGAGLVSFLASQIDGVKEIHAIDLQKSVLDVARINLKNKNVTLHEGFVEELAFESDYFNTVVMGEVIEHVYSVDKTLKEISRVLKKNGRLIMTCPYKGKLSKFHIRSISKSYLREKMEKYFNVKKIEILDYKKVCPNGLFSLLKKL